MIIIADSGIPFFPAQGCYGAIEVQRLHASNINASAVKKANALFVRTRTNVNAELVKESKLSFVGSATAGVDHIATAELDNEHISWCHAPASNANGVVQYVMTAIFYYLSTTNKKWNEVVVGIVGVGNIGGRIARICHECGVKALLNDPPKAQKNRDFINTPIEEVFKQSDIVTVHVPLYNTAPWKTVNFINTPLFSLLKTGALFINSSRGKVCDSMALEKEAKERVHHLVLDVFPTEPTINKTVLNNSLIATPHIAGYSTEGKYRATKMVFETFLAHFSSLKKNLFPSFEIPKPAVSQQIALDPAGKTEEKLIFEALHHTFPLVKEAADLKKNPSKFEVFRNNYPIRREPSYFTVSIPSEYTKIKKILMSLGFSVG